MLKRLWDTENKKMVFVKGPSGHDCQVWTDADGSHLYIYDCSQWIAYNPAAQGAESAKEYGPTRKALDDEEVGFYDTNVPTNLYNWDEGDEVAYAFKNGSTTLQSGKVKEGETPTYTGDTPTKAADAQYTYTFSGWKPTVGPIYKKTDYAAQFSKTVNKYTISIAPNDSNLGAVSESSLTNVPYGTKISVNEDTGALVIGEGESATTVTGTPAEGYGLTGWTDDQGEALPATLGGALSVVAVFEQVI